MQSLLSRHTARKVAGALQIEGPTQCYLRSMLNFRTNLPEDWLREYRAEEVALSRWDCFYVPQHVSFEKQRGAEAIHRAEYFCIILRQSFRDAKSQAQCTKTFLKQLKPVNEGWQIFQCQNDRTHTANSRLASLGPFTVSTFGNATLFNGPDSVSHRCVALVR